MTARALQLDRSAVSDASVPPSQARFADHADWARGIAISVHRRVWDGRVERADCIQDAMLGLTESIARFDPARGIPFRGFAMSRVRGAVFNGLRSQRDGYAGSRTYASAERVRYLTEGADDDDALDFFSGLIGALGIGFMVSDAWDAASEDACKVAERSEISCRLLSALDKLPERHRELLRHHYFLHQPFVALATDWGLTRGRVSQIHREALTHMKLALGAIGWCQLDG